MARHVPIRRRPIRRVWRCAVVGLGVLVSGCGTTRWSDTTRTATEQMLISDAADRAISQIDCSPLAGKNIYLETKYVAGSVDEKYVISTLRQHLLASGCIIKDKPEDARYIVEVRAGAVGTNRNDLLFGVPATSLPAGGMFPIIPTSIPEIPLMKRTNQQGVCKVAVFAYDRLSGRPVWQSGTSQVASKAKDVWIFGTGPFQRGTIYDGTKFAGEHLQVPLAAADEPENKSDDVWVSHEILFSQPPRVAQDAAGSPAPNPDSQATEQMARGAARVQPAAGGMFGERPVLASPRLFGPAPGDPFNLLPGNPASMDNRPVGYFEPARPADNGALPELFNSPPFGSRPADGQMSGSP